MPRPAPQPAAVSDRLDPAVLRVAAAVIVGTFMSIIDMTIVNVALVRLGRDLGASGVDQVQWVMTAYMLAVAAVIPITGWASERLGGRRLFVGSLVLFTLASALCAVSWDLTSLIVFRVVQGIAGGALMPAGQILLARAAGPNRMGRVMSVIGVPILLAPVFGPVLGGVILEHLPWEWIFLVNVPVGVVGVTLALRLLPHDHAADAEHRTQRRLDLVGLLLLATGLPLVVYGLANIAEHGIAATVSWLPIVFGLVLSIVFVPHALRHANPLLDVRLFANRAFTWASLTTFSLGAFLFGSIVLLPLYYQQARGEGVLDTGLLLAPQGIGAAIGIALTGRLADRIGGGAVTLMGLTVLLLGTIPFVTLDGDTSYWFITAAMLVRGVGFGSTMMPSMAAAYAALPSSAIPHATPQLSVFQRVGGAVGTALLATILQAKLSDAGTADAVGAAYGSTFWWVFGATMIAFVPATLLMRAERAARRAKAEAAAEIAHEHHVAEDLAAAAASGLDPA